MRRAGEKRETSFPPPSPEQPPQKPLFLPLLLLVLRRPQPPNQSLERRVAPQRREVPVLRRGPAVGESRLPHGGAQRVQSCPLVSEGGVGAGCVVKGRSLLAIGQRRGLVPFLLLVSLFVSGGGGGLRERERGMREGGRGG